MNGLKQKFVSTNLKQILTIKNMSFFWDTLYMIMLTRSSEIIFNQSRYTGSFNPVGLTLRKNVGVMQRITACKHLATSDPDTAYTIQM